ncbi:MAG: hypothetical protein KGR26_16110, partial [Cyanobacteria bacterium REEB65]|nr:hypothetical protein [Cyanobacteria bacterium REEB65]
PTERFDADAFVKRGALYLPKDVKIPAAAQMVKVWDELEHEVSADEQVSNLFKVTDRRRGVRLRFFIPQMDIDERNIGAFIHNVLKPAIKAAYEGVPEFKGRNFVDYRKDDTDGNVTIVDDGQMKLIAMLREGAVAGWLFPSVFQGVGIEGDRALMNLLPQKYNWSLGGIESLMATILHTKTLCRDNNTPVQDLASFQWQGPGRSLYVFASGSGLGFGGRALSADGGCSAALSVFRQVSVK